jgi:Tol biopolymer transport system component
MIKIAGKWSMPDTAFFSRNCWATEPAFSPDGQYLYYSSSKGKSDIRFYNLWRIKKNKSDWSEPESIIDIAGDNIMEFHPSITKDGSVYFCYWDYAKQIGDIYLSKNIGGKLSIPIKVNIPINTQFNNTSPFVDADETYMIFKSNRPGGYGDNDLYISFKKNDGIWGNPINMGSSFNTPNDENPIDVSPDGKYMFRYLNNNMYWNRIDNLIDSLKNTLNSAGQK